MRPCGCIDLHVRPRSVDETVFSVWVNRGSCCGVYVKARGVCILVTVQVRACVCACIMYHVILLYIYIILYVTMATVKLF